MEQKANVLTETKKKKAEIIADILSGKPVKDNDFLSVCTSIYLSGLRDGRKIERGFPLQAGGGTQ